jgi:S-(hydroxymethyl)glutathione dehydrogenase/alcohol dehydrogenase
MFEDGTWRFHEGETDIGGFCTLGTFSQYAVVSEWATVPLREDFQDIPWEILCLVGCGVPTGWGSAVHAAGVQAGDTVVIFGAGGVGSNAVQGARFAGAQNVVVVDPVEFKRDMATSVFGATHAFATAKEAHEFVVETTWGQLADHAIMTPNAVTEEMVNAAVQMTGKGGKVTITAVGHINERAVHVHAGLLIGYMRQVRGALFGDSNPLYDIPKLLGLYKSGQLKLDELVTRKYTLDQVNQAYQDMNDGKNIRGVIIHEH